MKDTQFLDTNIFLRYLTRDDVQKHQACLALFQQGEQSQVSLVTSESVIAEVVYVLSSPKHYQISRSRIQVSLSRLLVRVENVQAILEKQNQAGLIRRKLDPEQAYRVAWRNPFHWVVAQMTLLEIEMVKLEEVFLPYIVNPQGKSLFEVFKAYQFQLPLPQEK